MNILDIDTSDMTCIAEYKKCGRVSAGYRLYSSVQMMDEQSEYTARACAFPSDHWFFFIHPLRPLMEKQLSALTNCLYQPLRFKDWLSHHAAVRNQQPPTGNISRCAAWIRMLLVDWNGYTFWESLTFMILQGTSCRTYIRLIVQQQRSRCYLRFASSST